MTRMDFAEGHILFREGAPSDGVFRLLRGTVEVVRELDGDLILLGRVGDGQFIGEMGVVENRPRSATIRAVSEVEAEFFNRTEFLDQIVGSPRAARELIQRLSQPLREADDRIANDERRDGRAHETEKATDDLIAVSSADHVYLAAKSPWLQCQFHTPLGLGHLPFVVGRRPAANEGTPQWQPDLMLDEPRRLGCRVTTSRSKSAKEVIMCATSARPRQHTWNDRQRRAHRHSFPHRRCVAARWSKRNRC